MIARTNPLKGWRGFAVGLRACCVAAGLLLIVAHGAEPVSPLIGVTRDQLLLRMGEPKSQLERGNRVVYFYPRERIVLRDNVVVEVEPLAVEAPPPPPATSTTPSTGTPPAEGATSGSRPATSAVTPAPAPSDGKIEIKLVRPQSKDGRPPSAPPPRIEPAVTAPAPVSETVVDVSPGTSTAPTVTPPERQPEPSELKAKTESAENRTVEKKVSDDRATKTKKTEAVPVSTPPSQPVPPAPPESPIGTTSYVLAFVILVVGAFVLFWRYRQRQLELAASSVENTPIITATTPVFTGNAFSPEVLGNLEWKRFEELVVAYYNKTGVVALRTKAGPDSPVHVKISWKGEARPFAYVQCIAQPAALIDPKPLQKLVSALAADDIRRGYVVTAGRFSVPARDYAEEKHLTLLPGDIFIEKLNALPGSARTEIMQAVSAGDYTVPSCPKCEAKMVKSPDDPSRWRCPTHPDQTMPVRV